MRGLLTFVFYAIVLVLGGALEMMLPKLVGVGVPVLLGWTIWVGGDERAGAGGVGGAVVLAVAAGAFEDALSSLPFLTSVSFFVVAVLVARRISTLQLPFPFGLVLFLACPLYEAWVWLLATPVASGGWCLVLGAACLMSLAAAAFVAVFAWCERKAAL